MVSLQWFPAYAALPQRTRASGRRLGTFWLLPLGEWGGTAGIWWMEAKDAAQHPTGYGWPPPQSDPALDGSSAAWGQKLIRAGWASWMNQGAEKHSSEPVADACAAGGGRWTELLGRAA